MRDARVHLITGATGNTGSRVAAGLRALDLPVRTAGRRPRGADAAVFDWIDENTFAPALSDAGSVYLVAPVGVADPLPLVRPFLEQAVTSGVRRVVLLSSSAVARGEPALGELHDAVAESFDEYTVLRPSWFMQNFIGDHALAQAISRTRTVITATGDGRLGFIDAADIAAVAVRALISPEPIAEQLTLTGPEALSYPQVADLLTELLGDPVRHLDVTEAELAYMLVESGLAREFATGLASLDGRIRSGDQDMVTDVVERVTGRPPTSMRHFLSEHLPSDAAARTPTR